MNDINYEDIKIDGKERAIARTRYASFSKYCVWILKNHEDGNEIFYIKDLIKFAKISYPVAFTFFDSLVNLSYMEKIRAGNSVYFKLICNGKKPKLLELEEHIKKTLKSI